MAERVDARDVLDVNAIVETSFRGTIVGVFLRTGPNSWDDYVFERRRLGEVELLRGTEVHLEPRGAEVRMRTEGRVQRVRFIPSESEEESITDGKAPREVLCKHLRSTKDDAGIGAEAVVVRTIKGG